MTQRIRRSGTGALVALLAVAGLAVAPAAPAAAATPAQPEVVDVFSKVESSTPTWVVDFVFTLSGAPRCEDGRQSYLHVLIAPGVQFRNGSPWREGQSTGTPMTVDACKYAVQVDGDWQLELNFNVLNDAGNTYFQPSGYQVSDDGESEDFWLRTVNIWAKVLDDAVVPGLDLTVGSSFVGDDGDANTRTDYSAELPTPPVWVGMGDGYTSQLKQDEDGCLVTNETCTYDPNDQSYSWVETAIFDLNFRYTSLNSDWSIQRLIPARDRATSADLLGQQQVEMELGLDRHVLRRPAGHPGGDLTSWNWVGVSAGFVDVGIPQVMQAYSEPDGRFPFDGPGPAPWAVTDPADCPDLRGVLNVVEDRLADGTIKDNISQMIAAAQAVSPGTRVIQVLYPLLTETTNPCASAFAGNPANGEVIEKLNQAIDVSSTDDVVYPMNLVDLATGFGPFPTGDPENGYAGSRLWLTRPYGYPYPGTQGRSAMGTSAQKIVGLVETDREPPKVTGTPQSPPVLSPEDGANDQLWWNDRVKILWEVAIDDEEDLLPLTPVQTAGVERVEGHPWNHYTWAEIEGTQAYESAYEACDTSENCVRGSISLGIDSTPPAASVAQDPLPNEFGWNNTDVEVSWELLHDNLGASPSTGVDSSTAHGPTTVTGETDAAGRWVAHAPGFLCDRAKNCPAPAIGTTVFIDRTAPTLDGRVLGADDVPITPAPSGWFNEHVPEPRSVAWTATDFVSRVKVADDVAGVTSRVWEVDAGAGDGIRTFTRTAEDRADNISDQVELTIKVDRTDPTPSLWGMVDDQLVELDGAVFGPDDSLPTALRCRASDEESGITGADESGFGPCTLGTRTETPNDDGSVTYQFTLKAVDIAGNDAQRVVSFTAPAGTASNPPETEILEGPDPLVNTTSAAFALLGTPDQGLEIVDVECWIGRDGTEPAASDWASCDTLESHAGEVPTDGYWTLWARAIDNQDQVDPEPALYNWRVDATAPLLSVGGITHGGTYYGAAPTATCSGDDPIGTDGEPGSGFVPESCAIEQVPGSYQELPEHGVPGYTVELRATGVDRAGNVGFSTGIPVTVYTVTRSAALARMTGKSSVGGIDASFTLRCNGSPNQLNLSWGKQQSFDLVWVEDLFCWDQGDLEGNPKAPIDTLHLVGLGTLSDGSWARVELTLGDRDALGNKHDTMRVSLTRIDGSAVPTTPVFATVAGTSGQGNTQAHESQGNGTNDNGCLNGPTGHGAVCRLTPPAGTPKP